MIFLRHPAAAVLPGTCYGRLDVEAGPEHQDEIAQALAVLPPVRWLRTSPARRCRALADRIAAQHGVPAVVDGRLQELDFGAWEGRAWKMIDRAESEPWAADPWSVAPPGGETFAAMHARVATALSEAQPEAVIVTHAGVIRAARMILGSASFAAAFAAPVPCCTPIRIARAPHDAPSRAEPRLARRLGFPMDSTRAQR